MTNHAQYIQKQQAKDFLALHHAPQVLVLPNAWDVSSAKIFELAGFSAIGTTSAGIAATLGYPDGEHISLSETLTVVERILQHTDLLVSADIEAGYAASIDGVVDSARATLKAGAVGLNIEDRTGDPANPLFEITLQQEKIKAIRAMTLAEDVPLVINARTDVYLVDDGSPETRLRDAIERGNAYRDAGADCIFVPDMGDLDQAAMTQLVKEIEAPLNIIAGATTPPVAKLETIGVARVSLGPRPMRAALTVLRQLAHELLAAGTYQHLLSADITYAEVNQWYS